MAELGARAWLGVIASSSVNSDTDANTEAIIFVFVDEAIYAGQYTKARERCSRPWHSARRRSQCGNAYSKTDSEKKAVGTNRAQIADCDSHANESGGISDTNPDAFSAKRNAAATVTNFFRLDSNRIAFSDTDINTDADIDTGAYAITNSNGNIHTDAEIDVYPNRNAKNNRDTNSYAGFSADED